MRLSSAQRQFLVVRAAYGDSATQAARAFADRFGETITRQQAADWDPAIRKLPQKWVELYQQVRRKLLEDLSDEPYANARFRIRRLAAMARRAETAGNDIACARYLEQVAKECGDAYSNRVVKQSSDPIGELAQLLGVDREWIAGALGLENPTGPNAAPSESADVPPAQPSVFPRVDEFGPIRGNARDVGRI